MGSEVLNQFAEDDSGKIIHISKALSDVDYYCPECKEKFIFRKGNIRQHHFSHNNSSSNCLGTGEGYLHKAFKKMLFNKLIQYMRGNLPLEVVWKCFICNKEHNCNILNAITEIKDEYTMEICRPDIALITESGKVPIVIEIVDTHEPEKSVLEYYIKNNIILIQIKLDSIDDLENIENKIKYPLIVIYNNMICLNYRNYIYQQQLNSQIIQAHNIRRQGGPRIDQIESSHERDRQKRQHFAIQNYYKNKHRKK